MSLIACQLEIPDDGFVFEDNNNLAKIEEIIKTSREENKNIEQEEEYIPHHPGREPQYGENNKKKHKAYDSQIEEEIRKLNSPNSNRYTNNERVRGYEDLEIMNDDIPMQNKMGGMPNRGGMHGGRKHMGGGMGNNGNNMGDSFSYNSNNNNHIYNNNNNNNNNYLNPGTWFGSFYGSLYELMMFAFLIGFIFNCLCGKTFNDKYAMAWYTANKEYFEQRYEMIGLGKSDAPDELDFKMPNDSPLIKETPFIYKFYCAKYRYVKWLLAVLEFRKRTDAVYFVSSLFISNKDRLVFEVAINPIEEVGWMFCVCKKKDVKTLRSSYADIDFLANNHDPSIFNEKLTVLTENVELFIELFQNKNLLNFYKSVEQYVDLIYYTDQQTFCKEKFSLFFSFEVHLNVSGGNDRVLLEITHFVNLFCDTLAQLKYNEKVKKDFEKNRVMFERAKMEEAMRTEIEEKEKRDFIEEWKLKNKMKGKKANQKKKNIKDMKQK